jgi:Rrf2 family protein
MKLSTRSRYGARLMLELALNYGKGPVNLRDLAKSQEIPERYLNNIMILLKSSGLINSSRGAKGGYTLAREPHEINLMEIIETTEGGICIVECVDDSTSCVRVPFCITRDIWIEIERKIKESLSSLTLADMARMNKEKISSAYYSI